MRYEYKTAGGQIALLNGVLCWVVRHCDGQTDTKSKQPVAEWLNELGSEGWMLREMTQLRPAEWVIVLMRSVD
jgi:hypothetical protein